VLGSLRIDPDEAKWLHLAQAREGNQQPHSHNLGKLHMADRAEAIEFARKPGEMARLGDRGWIWSRAKE
jgi:hypothetical protein